MFSNTLLNNSQHFSNLISYCNQYIPQWKPNFTNPKNRIAYNGEFMFEIIFYKNLVLAIPLYFSNLNVANFENSITHIKNYCARMCYPLNGYWRFNAIN